jgi:hypothetical protein
MKLTAAAAASCLLALLFVGALAAAQQPFDASVYTSMGGPQDSIPVGRQNHNAELAAVPGLHVAGDALAA